MNSNIITNYQSDCYALYIKANINQFLLNQIDI